MQRAAQLLLLAFCVVASETGVRFADERVRFNGQPRDQVVAVGGSAVFWCVAVDSDGDRLSVRWLRDGRPLASAPHLDERVGALYLSNASTADVGSYQCAVSFDTGTVLSQAARLDVDRLPSITEHPVAATARIGAAARFACRVRADPLAEIRWFHNGVPLSAATDTRQERFLMPIDSVLQIADVHSSDEGNYLCVASNKFGNASSNPALLTTSGSALPKVDSSGEAALLKVLAYPRNLTVPEGEVALFECLFDDTSALSIEWKRVGASRRTDRATTLATNLLIRSVQKEDAGVYACVVRRAGKTITSLQATLTVSYGPRIVEQPANLVKRRGETARFECHTDALPVPQIVWYRDGKALQPHGRFKMFPALSESPSMLVLQKPRGLTLFKRDLVISSVQKEDEGVYQCFAENVAGVDSAAAALRLDAAADNVSSAAPRNLVAKTDQQRQRVLFEWQSPPDAPNIAVYILHFFVTERSARHNGENTESFIPAEHCAGDSCSGECCNVEQLLPYTNYTFRLSAWTLNGGSSTDFSNTVVVQTWDGLAVGVAPLVLTELTEGSVRLDWTQPDTSVAPGQIEEYEIQFYAEGDSAVSMLRVPFVVLEQTIIDLRPNTLYHVRVIPMTRAGKPAAAQLRSVRRYPWSSVHVPDASSETTLIDAPNLRFVAVNASALAATWAVDSGDGLSGFRVRFLSNGENERTFTVNASARHYVFSLLEADSSYEVGVAAVGHDGALGLEAAASARTAAAAADDRAPATARVVVEPPQHVQCEARGPGALTVRWLPPVSGRQIEQYEVRFSPLPLDPRVSLNASHVETVRVVGEQLNFSDLIPARNYLFAVRSFDKYAFSGPFSNDFRCFSPGSAMNPPPPPRDVKSEAVNESAVLVTWRPPPNASSDVVSSYAIYYTDTARNSHWASVVVNGTERAAIVARLAAENVYFFKVAARNDAGEGAASSVGVVVLPPPPSTPTPAKRVSYVEGVVIGVCISLLFLIACIAILLCRRRNHWRPATARRNSPWRPRPREDEAKNGRLNGHAVRSAKESGVELQTLLLTRGTDQLRDTKGADDSAAAARPAASNSSVPRAPADVCRARLTAHVARIQQGAVERAENSSGLSHSPQTASSLHSWSHEDRISQPTTSSLPNLTDSGIGIDSTLATSLGRAPAASATPNCWCRELPRAQRAARP